MEIDSDEDSDKYEVEQVVDVPLFETFGLCTHLISVVLCNARNEVRFITNKMALLLF